MDEHSSGFYADELGVNNGMCTGGCPEAIHGIIGKGQLFDGVMDRIDIDPDSSFNWSASQSFTIELWLRRNAGTINDGLEVFIGRADAAGLIWYIGINAAGDAQALLKAADGTGPVALTGTKTLTSSSTDPTWHHVVLVRDASVLKTTLHVDGRIMASQTYAYTAGFTSDTAPLTLGALNGDNHFSGGLDEVAIYGRALGENEIKSHYYVSRGYCSRYTGPLNIMPLGDSVTKGNWDADNPSDVNKVGYRLDLWDLLKNNLYWSDFIGSQQNGAGIDPDFNDDHAGFGGMRDDQLYRLLWEGYSEVSNPHQITAGPYLETYDATEIILLHIGTNDLDTGTTDVANILNQIDAFSKSVTVLLARIVNQAPYNGTVTAFNHAIAGTVADRIAQGDKIILIDMENDAGINYVKDPTAPYGDGDMYDSLHPNPSGYAKMAGKWFETLEVILPPSEIPVITSTAPAEAVKGQRYTYTVTATGPPGPAFALTTGPTGMTIDTISGLIQWTPDAAGDYEVNLEARNWAGLDTQSSTISVNALPQAVGDAYGGLPEGGTLNMPVTHGVLSNDADENDSLSAILVSDVSHGTLNLSSNGSFVYTHDGSENFSDGFTYKASDGKAESAPVAVSLGIIPVNDAPVITGQANLSTAEETALTITLANLIVTDPDNTYPADFTLSVQDGSNYTRNSAQITPNAHFDGILTIPVRVNDGLLDSNVFNLQATVTGINDEPVITGQMALSVPAETAIRIRLADLVIEDPDNQVPDDLILLIQSGADYHLSGGDTITPKAGFTGELSVPVRVADGTGLSNLFNLKISVTAGGGSSGGGGGGCFITTLF